MKSLYWSNFFVNSISKFSYIFFLICSTLSCYSSTYVSTSFFSLLYVLQQKKLRKLLLNSFITKFISLEGLGISFHIRSLSFFYFKCEVNDFRIFSFSTYCDRMNWNEFYHSNKFSDWRKCQNFKFIAISSWITHANIFICVIAFFTQKW